MKNWRGADLNDQDRAICEYVEKLTLTPARMVENDVERLRDAGLDDQGIQDTCTVAAYFAYMNRIADGLGVDLEPDMSPTPPWAQAP